MKVKSHWLTDAKRVKTNKYSRGRRISPKFVVMHFTAGWSESGDIHVLTKSKSKVSCQLIVQRDGTVIETMPLNNRAWHAGPSRAHGYTDLNSHSIGIEFCNLGWLKKQPNGTYRHWNGFIVDGASGEVVNSKRVDFVPSGVSDITAWPHTVGGVPGSGTFAWEPYTEAQLEAGDAIVEALRDAYGVKWVVSHEEIDTRGWKSDPGPAFPLQRYQNLVSNRETGQEEINGATTLWYPVVELNVRRQPEMLDNVITTIKSDDNVVIVGKHNKWYLIQSMKTEAEGWVYSSYLRRRNP